MQVDALAKRLKITVAKPVIGVSGGMDSTLALLVAAKATKKAWKTYVRSCMHYHACIRYN